MKTRLLSGGEGILQATAQVHMVDQKKHKFQPVGQGVISLCATHFHFVGVMNGQTVDLRFPVASLPTLPFTPGKCLDIQQGDTIYRCVLDDGKLAMKFVNMIKIFHQMHTGVETKTTA